MTWTTRLLTAAALAAVLAAPQTAQARFGKRDPPSSSRAKDSDDDDKPRRPEHRAAPATPSSPPPSSSSREHRAVPVYTPSGPSSHYSPPVHHDYRGSPPHDYGRHHHHYYGWGFGYSPWIAAPPPEVDGPKEPAAVSNINATLAANVQVHGEGSLLGLDFALEGERLGMNATASVLFALTAGTTDQYDTIRQVDAHLTYALLAGAHGRLRLEAGLNSAFAEDLSVAAPDLGMSTAVGLVGPIGLEASMHYAIAYHARFRWNAGVTLGLGPLGIRAGWQQVVLDDRGSVGERHVDSFVGPYFGAGLVF